MKVKKGEQVKLAISLVRGKDAFEAGSIGTVVNSGGLFSSTVTLEINGKTVRDVNPDYLEPAT